MKNSTEEILKCLVSCTCLKDTITKEAAIIAVEKLTNIIEKLEAKNKEALDTLDDCLHHHDKEVRQLKDRIEFLEKEKLIADGGKRYIMGLMMKEQRNSDKAFLESIEPEYRTPFQQAYLDHIIKENS